MSLCRSFGQLLNIAFAFGKDNAAAVPRCLGAEALSMEQRDRFSCQHEKIGREKSNPAAADDDDVIGRRLGSP